jgi:hypothetical protein
MTMTKIELTSFDNCLKKCIPVSYVVSKEEFIIVKINYNVILKAKKTNIGVLCL